MSRLHRDATKGKEMNKHAQAMGRMGKGKPKTLTESERQRRSAWAKNMTKKRMEKRNAPTP